MKTVLATRGKRQRTALISGSMFTLILAVAGTTVGLAADAHTSDPHVVADDAQLVDDGMDGETQMSDDPLVESDLKDENFEND
ncbi:hypothetical protein JCM19039_3537 [Geomicrobium sp. JCM 19039]|nr:hypothetical protein JCM19039_3537 [Geomicrobium sp. JCM 19039]